jgi:hypothetical protein
MRNRFWHSLPLGPVLIFAACVGEKEIIEVLEEVATVAVAPNTETMRPGETRQLAATVTGENGMALQRTLQWTSSDNATATVSPSGLVTAVRVGPVTITASTGGKSGTSNITIAQEPPTVVTLPATNVTSTGGEANGRANPNGGATTASFEWGTSAALGQTCDPPIQIGSGTTNQDFKCIFATVAPGTTIHYRAYAENAGGISRGQILTFTTTAAPPVVVTLPATNVTASGGVANATVNPKGSQTSANFEFGATNALGSFCTPAITFPAVDEERPIICTFSNRNPGTTVFYRIIAVNAGGTSTGETLSFTTLGGAPTVVTLEANNVTTTSGNVRGSVNPNGLATTATVEFGPTAALGATCPGTVDVPLTGSASVVFCTVSPNAPGVTVFYRIWAQNASGISTGEILSFTTLTSGPATGGAAAASRPVIEGIAEVLTQAVQATGPLDAMTSTPLAAFWTGPSTPALITARMEKR